MSRGSRYTLAIVTLAIAGALGSGCAVEQLPPPPVQVSNAPVRSLPFKGRLVQGDLAELPPDVAASLSQNSPVTFMYREELTHDESHPSMWSTALAPSTYAGGALGEYGVNAFAELTILDGDKVVGDYIAKARVWRQYSLYSAPTHAELERAARNEVRRKIDEKLEQDSSRLAQEIGAPPAAPAVRAGQ